MDDRAHLRQVRVISIMMAICLLVAIGFFFYGLVNHRRAEEERKLALDKQKACEKMSVEYAQQLQSKEQQLISALDEVRQAKEFALAKVEMAKRAEKK